MGQEFIRVGYYVNNDYDDEQLREEPPPKVLVERIQRNILADKPRVTKFPINFHPENSEHGGEQNSSPPAEAINNEEEEEELQASPLPSPSPPPSATASDEPSLEQDAVDTEAQPSVTAN